MATYTENTLIKYNELPKINGVYIKDIYAYEHSYYWFSNEICPCTKIPDFYVCYPYFLSDKKIIVKILPDELMQVFGFQTVNNKKHFITSLCYRTSGSGNGSFTDETMYISGNREYLQINRDIEDYGIGYKSELGQKMLATLNTNFTVKECDEWEYTFYPTTHLRKEGKLLYPDTALPSWRWLNGMPFVSYDNNKNIRVFNEKLDSHIYLGLKTDVEAGDVVIGVNFSRKDNNFCNIYSWSESKKEDPNGMIRWKVISLDENYHYVKCQALVNDIPQDYKRDFSFDEIFTLNSISPVVR